jgi:hypothetical protein
MIWAQFIVAMQAIGFAHNQVARDDVTVAEFFWECPTQNCQRYVLLYFGPDALTYSPPILEAHFQQANARRNVERGACAH